MVLHARWEQTQPIGAPRSVSGQPLCRHERVQLMYALAVERLHEWQPLRREVLVDEEEACRADGEWAEEGENEEVRPTHYTMVRTKVRRIERRGLVEERPTRVGGGTG